MKRKKKHNSRSRAQKHFSQPKKDLLTGRVQKNPRGFAFLIAQGNQGIKDTYVSPAQAQSLMSGDLVEFRIRHHGRRSEAEVVRVLERATRKLLGKIRSSYQGYLLETPELDVFQITGTEKDQLGQWVIAEIEKYPDPRNMGVAKVKTKLGKSLLPEHDALITLSRFGIEERFPQSALEEATQMKAIALNEVEHPHPKRKDLRDQPFVTIDGEDAKDFDDAILVTEHTGNKAFSLYVAIADVSFFVRPGSALDTEAVKRSTSTYFPGYCIPMLPEALSNDLCSLNPQTDKLALVAEVELDRNGHILGSRFYEAIIKTVARLTYTQVHSWFGGETHALPPSCQKPMESAKRLFHLLHKKRKERGVLDFQLPECRFELDARAVPTKAYPYPQWESHQLIEEFMILANTVVAKALKDAKCPSLYRVHEAPELESIEELNQLMKSLGFSIMLKEASPIAFSEVLRQTGGKKGASTLHKAVLRAQKQARYEPDPKGHFGLALTDYTHFTSPIRRYPDLVVHRSLKRFILQEKSTDKQRESDDLIRLGEITSERERRAMEAERFINRRKQCWFMSKRLGENFAAVISGVIAKGVFVEIVEHAIEGFVPIECL